MSKVISLEAEKVQISEAWETNLCFWLKEVFHIYRDSSIETIALRGVNLKIHQGQHIGIIGPSGSGKTTLINILGGLLKPSAGRIYFKDEQKQIVNLTDLSMEELTEFRRMNIGFVFQEYNLFDYLTVEENVQVPLLIRDSDESQHIELINEALKLCSIEHRRSYKINQLSGGEKQRVQIAMAIISKPKIIFADEPTGNLDSENSHNIFQLLNNLSEIHNIAVITVSHDHLIKEYTDSILTLKDGLIVED